MKNLGFPQAIDEGLVGMAVGGVRRVQVGASQVRKISLLLAGRTIPIHNDINHQKENHLPKNNHNKEKRPAFLDIKEAFLP